MKTYKQKDLGYKRTHTKAWYRVTFDNGEAWEVPVQCIVDSRDENYAGDKEDTAGSVGDGSLDPYDITDWAANNMNWSDVEDYARKVETKPKPPDWEDGWMNGEKEIIGDV